MAQAQKMLKTSSRTDMPAMVLELLPSLTQWNAALAPFISRVPDPSLAIANPFGGSLSLISPTSAESTKQTIFRDGDGNSTALRLAQYTIQIVKSTDVLDSVTCEQKTTICKCMALFLQFASDNLSIPGSMPLWESTDLDTESEIVDFVTEAQSLLGGWLHSRDPSMFGSICEVQKQLLDESCGLTASSYYSARAYSALTVEIAELRGPTAHTDNGDMIKGFRRSNDVFAAAAYLTSDSESGEELFKLCNYLLTDLTGHDFRKNGAEGMYASIRLLVHNDLQ